MKPNQIERAIIKSKILVSNATRISVSQNQNNLYMQYRSNMKANLLGRLNRHSLNQIGNPARVTGFIVVPSNHFHGSTHHHGEPRIKNTGMWISNNVGRYDWVFGIFQDTFHRCFCRFFKCSIYLFYASFCFQLYC